MYLPSKMLQLSSLKMTYMYSVETTSVYLENNHVDEHLSIGL